MANLRDQLQSTLGTAYVIERELGGGGMSRVFLAEECALHRRVVIKVLPPEMAASVSMERFQREIMLAARLQHPHIVPLLSAGESEGLPYLTMPFVDGESLRLRIKRGGELPIPEGVRILREVASALDYAHDQGIVHRDIKPDNVLLSRGSAMVTDFGVAKALSASSNAEHGEVTSIGIALGTPAYMSPEQAAASPNIDGRADIYAFGVMAYELFAGRPPFSGRAPQALLAAHVTEAPEAIQKLRPSLPPVLATLIMKCLEKHAADRPQHAAEIVQALDAVLTPGGGSTPERGSAPTRERWPIRSGPPTQAIVLASVAVLVALITFAAVRGVRATHDTGPVMLVVLPFDNQGQPADQYFADGLADAITNRLASVRTLGVIAQRSAIQYRHSPKTLSEIGRELGVQYVLQGTVRWQTDGAALRKVQVSPSLVRVSDGTVKWAGEPYIVVPSDVFTVQSDIAARVASALNVAIGDANGGRADEKPTQSPDAYDAYLHGLEFLQRFWSNSSSQLNDLAVGQFERAVHLDTTFALAEAKLAEALFATAFYTLYDSATSRRLKVTVARALSLSPDLPEAHLVRGLLLELLDGDFPSGIREMQRAVDLRPGDASMLSWLGDAKAGYGDSTGLQLVRRAAELDPRSGISLYAAMNNSYLFRRYADAERFAKQLEALAPDSPDALAFEAGIALSAHGDTTEVNRLLGLSGQHAARTTAGMLLAYESAPGGARRIARVSLPTMATQTAYDSLTYYSVKGFAYALMGRADLRARYGDSLMALLRRHPATSAFSDAQLTHGTMADAAWLAGDHAKFEHEAVVALRELSAFGARNYVLAPWSCRLASRFAADRDVPNAVKFERVCLSVPSGKSAWDVRRNPEWAATRSAPEVHALLREFPAPD